VKGAEADEFAAGAAQLDAFTDDSIMSGFIDLP